MLGKATSKWMEGRKEGKAGPAMEFGTISAAKIRYVHFPDEKPIDVQVKRMVHRSKQGEQKPKVHALIFYI